MSHQTLKSATQGRVNLAQARKLHDSSRIGNPSTCSAGAGRLHFDIYNRRVSQNTLHLADSACSVYTKWSSQARQHVEVQERPRIPIAAAGFRGAGDFMGLGRDIIPQNIYGEGERGNMVRHSNLPNNSLPESYNRSELDCQSASRGYYHKPIQPYQMKHDATHTVWRG